MGIPCSGPNIAINVDARYARAGYCGRYDQRPTSEGKPYGEERGGLGREAPSRVGSVSDHCVLGGARWVAWPHHWPVVAASSALPSLHGRHESVLRLQVARYLHGSTKDQSRSRRSQVLGDSGSVSKGSTA